MIPVSHLISKPSLPLSKSPSLSTEVLVVVPVVEVLLLLLFYYFIYYYSHLATQDPVTYYRGSNIDIRSIATISTSTSTAASSYTTITPHLSIQVPVTY